MESRTKTLEELIFGRSDSKVKIPKYQRPYAWGPQQIEEFWDDLVQESPSLFLGPVIVNIQNLNNDSDSYIEVVDGQQRLITSTILASVIRDTYEEFGKYQNSQTIQSNFISHVDLDNNDLGFRLETGLTTEQFFKKYIQNKDQNINESNPLTPEEKRIKNNYQNFKELLIKHISHETSNEQKIGKIGEIRDKLNKLKVIEIQINSDSEAYEIFERVNNYGIDLSLSDLLKNHILKNHNDTDDAHRKWHEIEDNVRSSDSEMKKFIRYHWLSKYRFNTEKKIYNDIKDEITNMDSFLNELHESSEIYLDILKGERTDFSDLKVKGKDISKKIFNIIYASRNMGISQDNVFYLSLIRNIRTSKLTRNPSSFFVFLENFLFKYFAICKLPANRVERLFSKYSIRLDKECNSDIDNRVTKLDAMFNEFKEELRELLPQEEYFIEKFSEVKYSVSEKGKKLVYYILNKYNSFLSSNSETVINWDEVNIEHFLPQKPESWGLTKAEIKDYVHSIGNLTLIHRRLNSKMGNKPIEDKIPALEESELNINKDLLSVISEAENKWDEDVIAKRAKKISSLAYSSIWNF